MTFFLNCEVDAYAVDSTLTAAWETVEEISTKMTENCELVNGWMKGNKLKLNASKTHLLTVGTGVRLRIQESSVVVSMDGCILGESRDKVETLLGVQIEPSLKWHKQIEELLKKLKKRLTGLPHLRSILSYDVRKRITEGMFTSSCSTAFLCLGGVTRLRWRLCRSCRTRLPGWSPMHHREQAGRTCSTS